METIAQLLDEKGYEVWTINRTSSVYDAVALMASKDVGALVVTEGDKTVGLVSERDYVRRVALDGRTSRQTRVAEIMATRVPYARLDQTVEECMALMTDKRVRHLPVMQGEELIGIISIGDLVKAIIAEQQFIIEQLEHYIIG